MSLNTDTSPRTTVREETKETEDALYTYTLSSKSGDKVANYGLTLYSVEIQMTDKNGVHTASSLEDIFSDSGTAFKFFDKLSKNLATPIDLPYIFEDELK